MTDISSYFNELEALNVSQSYLCAPDQCFKYINCNKKSLTVIHLNICSINCNFDQFQTLLSTLNIQCDIIILTECWLSVTPYLPKLNNFTSYQTIDDGNQNAGVVIYIRNTLDCNVFEPKIIKEADCLVCTLGTEFAFIAVYRSPSYKNTDIFLNSINDLLLTLKSYKTVGLIGDLNIDIHTCDSDNRSDNYLNLMAAHGLLPTYTYPTRLQKCIDHILLKTDKNSTAIVLESSITDHYPTLLSLQLTREKSVKSITSTKINYEQIKIDLASFDFSQIKQLQNVNSATDLLVSSVSDIINKNTVRYTPPRSKRNLKPWITPGLLRCIRNRDRMHKQLKKQHNNVTLAITYSRYRNYINKLLKKLKKEYNRQALMRTKNDPKLKWKAIKEITNIAPSRVSSKALLKSTHDPTKSVNEVNNYFVNVGRNLANTIGQTNKTSFVPPTAPVSSPRNSFALFNVTNDEINDHIMNLRRDCATGWDNISSRILQSSREIFVPLLRHIFQLSLTSGVFPDAFKKAIIHPIYKGGDGDDVTNYRPISVLTAMSKLLEKIINSRLLRYLNANNIISNNQYGFRAGRSTEDAVSALVDDIVDCFEKQRKGLGLFLDLSKAFDTVSIPKLLLKLEAVGIRGVALDLFRSYLSNRTQKVKIEEYTSEEEYITTGVPQGSVLGPTLFIIYINDLCKLTIPFCNIYTYADDTALLVSGRSWEEAQIHAESALAVVMSWLSDNLLSLNLSKTNCLPFGLNSTTLPSHHNFVIKAHICQNLTPNCTCSVIPQVTNVKYLGIILDQKLKWLLQIKSLISRVRKMIFVFKNLRNVADSDTLKNTYFALCQSILMYGVRVWGSAAKTNLLPLERAQRAVLKVMTRKPYRYPTSQLYTDVKVLAVRQLFVLQTVLKKHSLLKFDPNLNANRRRHLQYKVCIIPQHRTSTAARNFSVLGAKLYNKLNKESNIYSCSKFVCKKRVQKFLHSLNYDETENLLL